MSVATGKEIEEVQDKLRKLDESIQQLGGRSGPNKRFSTDGPDSGRKRRHDFEPMNNFRRVRYNQDDVEDDDDDMRPKRSLQSTVVMPSIETKSREEKIEELNKKENKQVVTRNKRMFSNLLMGTLSRFQRDEKKIQSSEKKQAEKLVEIEKKLDSRKREEKEKIIEERRALVEQRREQERELRALTRKKALIQYAEAKQEHYRLLQNSIQTQTKPTLFFQPVKHTLRSLELLKNSQKVIEGLKELRQKELERELAGNLDEEHSDGEGAGETLKSFVATGSPDRRRSGRDRKSRDDEEEEKEVKEHEDKEDNKESKEDSDENEVKEEED